MSAAWRASEGPQERSLAQEDLVDHEASMGSETEGEEGNMNEMKGGGVIHAVVNEKTCKHVAPIL
jgi:hypothetical protein